MKRAIVAALAALFLAPWELSDPGAYAQAPQTRQTVKKKKAKVVKPAPRVSRYSSEFYDPSYDVYVKGAYVGSDPDPRIRWTMEKEAKGGYGLK